MSRELRGKIEAMWKTRLKQELFFSYITIIERVQSEQVKPIILKPWLQLTRDIGDFNGVWDHSVGPAIAQKGMGVDGSAVEGIKGT